MDLILGMPRRRWSRGEKLAAVAATFSPGMTVTEVARNLGIRSSMLFAWRKKLHAETGFPDVRRAPTFVPVTVTPDAVGFASASPAAVMGAGTIEISFTLGRRNWTFAGSDRGGQRAAAIYTLLQTAKLNSVDPQAWLADVLFHIADTPTFIWSPIQTGIVFFLEVDQLSSGRSLLSVGKPKRTASRQVHDPQHAQNPRPAGNTLANLTQPSVRIAREIQLYGAFRTTKNNRAFV